MQVSIQRDILNSFDPQESVNMLGGLANVLLKMGVMQLDESKANPYLPRLDLLGNSLFHKYADKPEDLKKLHESYVKS